MSTVSIKDQHTEKLYSVTVTPDPYGLVIDTGGARVLLTITEGRLNVSVGKRDIDLIHSIEI